jgi:hypothetical protein
LLSIDVSKLKQWPTDTLTLKISTAPGAKMPDKKAYTNLIRGNCP